MKNMLKDLKSGKGGREGGEQTVSFFSALNWKINSVLERRKEKASDTFVRVKHVVNFANIRNKSVFLLLLFFFYNIVNIISRHITFRVQDPFCRVPLNDS